MIKLEHTVLPSPEQMQFVIEGMRNPMNSWDKSDSYENFEVEDVFVHVLFMKCLSLSLFKSAKLRNIARPQGANSQH